MPCHCTVDVLRLFVRSIAQVDLPASNTFAISTPLSIQSFRAATGARRYLPPRAFSTAPSPETQGSNDGPTNAQSASRSLKGLDGQQQSLTTRNIDSAIVDFSPDAVDAIAADFASQEPVQTHKASSREYATPLASLLEDVPSKQLKPFADPVPRTTFKKAKLPNDSFTLHFSGPRNANPNVKIGKSMPRPTSRDAWTPPVREHWQIDKEALAKKFPDGWNPRKRLSPDAVTGIRALHAQMPERYTTEALSQEFGVTAEAIRRILKSKWSPSPEEETDRQQRWLKRGQQVWTRYAALGLKPPKPWREIGIGQGKPEWMKRKQEWAKRQKEPRIMPTLITTARRREAKSNGSVSDAAQGSSLADRIL
ncbi:hypothetical protein N431DRAFT_437237 [Stipitochalara longipes BDJ]|nr:hypothetical protein N431DRAFT_437237 [Stipitochalara longipes BDJ]